MDSLISHDDLLRLVSYDPEAGIITRRVRTSNRVRVGDAIGSMSSSGYLMGIIAGQRGCIHQFAWFYVHGTWPDHWIDHKDGDKLNNRINNLRQATASQNLGNKKRQSNNTSGFKGVHPKRNKWCAQIKHMGKCQTLGVFVTREEAHQAYCEAAQRIFGEFARAA